MHESKVVKGLEDITWRSTVSYPSMPQNSSAIGDGVVVEVEVEVTVISEDVLEVTGMGLVVEESLDNDSVDKVLETRTGLEEALPELELPRDEELIAELEETASHFPNPG